MASKSKTTKRQKATPSRAGEKWQTAFLSALRESGVISVACEAAKIHRATAYRHRERSKSFEAKWNEALEDFADSLEIEATRRARDGIKRDVYYQGAVVGDEFEYSDHLMGMMLKAKRPDQYADKLIIKVDPAHLAVLDKAGLTPSEAWLQLIQELANASANATSD